MDNSKPRKEKAGEEKERIQDPVGQILICSCRSMQGDGERNVAPVCPTHRAAGKHDELALSVLTASGGPSSFYTLRAPPKGRGPKEHFFPVCSKLTCPEVLSPKL